MIDLIGLSNGYIVKKLMNDDDLIFTKINIDWMLCVIEEMLSDNKKLEELE